MRLALELLLNIAARRYDAHQIGEQHVQISNKDGKKTLCWRPHKTLRTIGKMLKIRIIPSLQAALDAMPKPERETELPLAFLTNEYGRKFASAGAFGNRFADWCKQACLKPVLCDDWQGAELSRLWAAQGGIAGAGACGLFWHRNASGQRSRIAEAVAGISGGSRTGNDGRSRDGQAGSR